MPALTRRDLNHGLCGRPGCDHTAHDGLFLHGRCHPSADLQVEYRGDGILRVSCAICERLVVEIAVQP